MILRDLTLSNFLVFHGDQKLTFPSENDQNVTLILANNNTGKTSIIRALKFLFYGSKALTLNKFTGRPSTLISERAAHEVKIGENVEAKVELTFVLGDQDYRFSRRVVATMTRDGLDRGEEKLTEFVIGEHRVEKHEDDEKGTLEAKLRSWMPRGLFDAFYFQGEPLDGKMLEGVSTISMSLSGFLHIDKWEEAAEALAKVQQDYERQLETIASTSREYQSKLTSLHSTEKHLAEKQALTAKLSIQIQELESQEATLAEELRRLGDTSEHDKLIRRRDELRNQINSLGSDLDRNNSSVAQLVEASQGAVFILPAVESARRILSEMEKANILPADITEGFVQRILAANACVCGRSHTADTKDAWSQYLHQVLSAKMSHRLIDVLNRVADGSRRGPVEAAATTRREIAEAQKRIEGIKRKLSAARQDVENIDQQIRESPFSSQREKIAATVDSLREVSARLRSAQGEKGQLGGVIANLELSTNRLRKEAKAAEPKGKAAAKIAAVERAISISKELRGFISEYRVGLRKRLHERLQALVATHYNPHAVDRTQARIDPNSFLPMIVNQAGQQQALVGGGQQTLLSLAYVSALANLRREIHDTMRDLNLYLGKAHDQSFVVDSPFSATDPNYVRAIASFLTGGARQVIILMARQQWDQAGPHLLPKASRIYALRLHTKLDELKQLHAEDFDFQVGAKTHRLVAGVDDIKKRRTELLEIK